MLMACPACPQLICQTFAHRKVLAIAVCATRLSATRLNYWRLLGLPSVPSLGGCASLPCVLLQLFVCARALWPCHWSRQPGCTLFLLCHVCLCAAPANVQVPCFGCDESTIAIKRVRNLCEQRNQTNRRTTDEDEDEGHEEEGNNDGAMRSATPTRTSARTTATRTRAKSKARTRTRRGIGRGRGH